MAAKLMYSYNLHCTCMVIEFQRPICRKIIYALFGLEQFRPESDAELFMS